jgi:leader peptidase (prepilin peptidase)/N-methyltransferase
MDDGSGRKSCEYNRRRKELGYVVSDTGFLQIIFFVLGALIGSFLNVVVYRIPRDKSIVHPRSSCPACGSPIRFYDNIPFFSYIVLRGRCRNCGQRISIRYFAVEMITAIVFAACFHVFGFSVDLPVALVFVCLLIVISFIDLDFMTIPDIMSLGGLFLGVVFSLFRPYFSFFDSLLGVLVGGGILFVIAKSYEFLRKKEGMGGGDIKLLGMIGAFWGVKGVVFSLVTGSLIGTIVGVPLVLIKRENAQYALPFGPFLSVGALIYVIAGDDLVNGFFRLFAQR